MRGIEIAVDNDDLEQCKVIGKARVFANRTLKNKDIASYDAKRFHLTPEQNNALGVLGEVAVIIHGELDAADPEVWTPYVSPYEPDYYKQIKQPDVLKTFEVRHVNTEGSPLVVRAKDVEADAIIVTVYTPHFAVNTGMDDFYMYEPIITGWMPARKAWGRGITPPWSDGTDRIVPIGITIHPKHLKAEIDRVNETRITFKGMTEE